MYLYVVSLKPWTKNWAMPAKVVAKFFYNMDLKLGGDFIFDAGRR